MPLLRNWTLLLLLALAGAAPLARADDGQAIQLPATEAFSHTREVFAALGYKIDAGRHVFKPDGSPLTQAQYQDLVAPVDFRKEQITGEEKYALSTGGCRFQDDTGRILCLEEKTGAKNPLVKIMLAYQRRQMSLASGHQILERMSLLLSQQDPTKPVPADVTASLKDMLASSPGAAVPDSLVKALNAPGAKTGDARAAVERAYEDSTRFFDGRRGLGDLLKGALPVVPGFNEPRRSPQFFDDTERKLGLALSAAAQERFKQSPEGRELLAHYGKGKLPPFLVLPLDPRMGAVYNPSNKTIVVNQQNVIDSLTKGMSETDAAALRARLGDSGKFAAYMLAHPEARDAFIKTYDVELYHELTHGWQDRRERMFDEMDRGNVPGSTQIEFEQEAFLAECRYMQWKVTHEPAAAKDDPFLPEYMQYVTNPSKFRADVAQLYLQNFPKDAANLATVEDLQKERVSVARRLMGENLHSAAVELLRMLGMAQGDAQIARSEAGESRRVKDFNDFLKNKFPQDQKEGRRAMVEIYLLKAKDEKLPLLRDNDLLTAQQWADAAGDPALIERVKKAREQKK